MTCGRTFTASRAVRLPCGIIATITSQALHRVKPLFRIRRIDQGTISNLSRRRSPVTEPVDG